MRIVFAILVVLCLNSCEKYALDRQMEELCAKDGGLKVYETIRLPPQNFDDAGIPVLGKRSNLIEERLGPDYRLLHATLYLKKGDPVKGAGQLVRSHWELVRVSDEKVLVEAIVYGRSGGDFLVFGHFTSKGCPDGLGAPQALLKAAFVIAGN